MARRALAPTHDLCARMRFIPSGDSAWDEERIIRESKAMGKDDTDPDKGHPFWRYQAGRTRFDLEADGIRDYIDFAKAPETWLFRRLPWEDRETIAYMQRQGRHESAMRMAFLRGCVGLENPVNESGVRLAKLLAAADRDEEKILAAVQDYAASAIGEVGEACVRGSQDLTPQEKKHSDSQPGPISPASTEG